MTTVAPPAQQKRPGTQPPPAQQPTKAMAPIDVTQKIESLEELSKKYSPTVLANLPGLTKAVTLARGIQEMRELVAMVWPSVRHLMGNKLGFKTDRDRESSPYPDSVIVDCLTEALLRDVRWVGNELNIISGGLYVTREGYERKVTEIPALTNLKLYPGIPGPHAGGAIVPFVATWNVDGVQRRMERQIPVKLNKGMGDDGALGKAERKMLASIFKRETGSPQEEEDVTAELPPAASKAIAAPGPDEQIVKEYSNLLYAAATSGEILAISDRIKNDTRLTPAGVEKLRPIGIVLIKSFRTREAATSNGQARQPGDEPADERQDTDDERVDDAEVDAKPSVMDQVTAKLAELDEMTSPAVVNDFLVTNFCQRESLPKMGEHRWPHVLTALERWELELRSDSGAEA